MPIPLHNNKPLVNSMDLEHCLQTVNQMLMENLQLKSRICYRCRKGKHQLDQKCAAINATCNKLGKKGHYVVICQKGKGLSCSSKSVHIAKTMDSVSTEPDYYIECGQPVYMQSHMLQTA